MASIPSLSELAQSSGELGSPHFIESLFAQAQFEPGGMSTENLTQIIRKDPSSVFRLLRIAHSGLYDVSSQMANISEAIEVIGADGIADIIKETTVINWFKGIPQTVVSMNAFWSHSIVTALITQKIAEHAKVEDAEPYYLAGLLHDIGRLILYWKIPSLAFKALNDAEKRYELLYRAEKNTLEYDHANVGKTLTKLWNFPKIIKDGVAFHHCPADAKNEFKAAAFVHIADVLANYTKIGTTGEKFLPNVDKAAWEETTLGTSDVDEILSAVRKDYAENYEALLSLEL